MVESCLGSVGNIDHDTIGLTIPQLVVLMSLFGLGCIGWVHVTVSWFMKDLFWQHEDENQEGGIWDGIKNAAMAFFKLTNESSSGDNKRSFVQAVAAPGTILMLMLLTCSSVLTETYSSHYAPTSKTGCVFPLARYDKDKFMYAPSDLLVAITMLTQTVCILLGLTAVFGPSHNTARLSAVGMAYMFPVAACGSIIHLRQYFTPINIDTELGKTFISIHTGYDNVGTAVSVAFFFFVGGCALFAAMGLIKSVTSLITTGEAPNATKTTGEFPYVHFRLWVGWISGMLTAGTVCGLSWQVYADKQITDIGNIYAKTEACHIDDQNMFAHFIFGAAEGEDKLDGIVLAAAIFATVSSLWYVLSFAALFEAVAERFPMMVKVLTSVRGINTSCMYISVALFSVLTFANLMSPCEIVTTDETEDLFLPVPILLLAIYYSINVYRVSVKGDIATPFYHHMGDANNHMGTLYSMLAM